MAGRRATVGGSRVGEQAVRNLREAETVKQGGLFEAIA